MVHPGASVFVEALVRTGRLWDRQMARALRPDAEGAVAELTVQFRGLAPPETTRVRVEAHRAPSLPARDVVTPPVVVPPGGVLRFAIGVEEIAWRAGGPALEFSLVASRDGAEDEVFRRHVDPAGMETDRQWRDAQVDVSHLAGETVRWRFQARRADGAAAGSSLPVWADPILLDPSAGLPHRNVLLVSLDTLRARSLSAYGCERATTPSLDTLMAAQGALFENASTPAPHTLPSHMSLFSGLYPHTHGVRNYMRKLHAKYRTLTEVLRAAGYATAAFTENGFLIAQAGFRRGFAVYHENKSPNLHRPLGQIGDTFGRGRAWLRWQGNRPFFLFLHTYEVHFPYVPPADYRSYFGRAGSLPPGPERDRLLYEQEIRYTDDHVRALLEELDDLGLADSTLVIVTSDHGEEFMEHGRRRHGFQLYEESTRVPLLMRWPGIIPAGLRVTTPVSLVDLAPTILDLLGISELDGADGRSLVPLLQDPARSFGRSMVFAATKPSVKKGSGGLYAARAATHKCILRTRSGEYECYDLTVDPGEHHVLDPGDLGDEGSRLRVAVDRFSVLAAQSATGAPKASAPDAATEEKLRALGYLD
jgi:arylsulfatase A-like enzyme